MDTKDLSSLIKESSTANYFRKISNGDYTEDEISNLISKCIMSKLLSEIKLEVAFASLHGETSCNISINRCIINAPLDQLKDWSNSLKEFYEELNFEVVIHENIISLDWSKNDPCGELDDDFEDDTEKYESMHKQKSKKQHAPKKHNLRVIK